MNGNGLSRPRRLNSKQEGGRVRLTMIYPAEATPTCPELVPPSTSRGGGEGESKTRGLLESLLKKKLAPQIPCSMLLGHITHPCTWLRTWREKARESVYWGASGTTEGRDLYCPRVEKRIFKKAFTHGTLKYCRAPTPTPSSQENG